MRHENTFVIKTLTDVHTFYKMQHNRCNTPKYTLAVFDMFRVFCKCNLNVSGVKCKTWKRETRKFTRYKDKIVILSKNGLKSHNLKRL